MLSTTFIYITIEIMVLIAITLIILKNIKNTDNSYFIAIRNPKLKFPNKQVNSIMKYIYIGRAKYELRLTSDNKLDF